MMRKIGWIGLLLLPATGCSGIGDLVKAQASFHQTADVQGVRQAFIETRNGSVTVENSQAGEPADISGTKYAGGSTLQQAQSRLDQIEIRVERQADHPDVLRIVADFKGLNAGSPGATFKVTLPPGIGLSILTSNAPITASDRTQDVKAETSNGSINVSKVEGSVVLRTSNGPVNAHHISGNVEAISSNGSIQLEQVGADRVRADTSNGPIIAVNPRGNVHLVSSNGTVTLRAGGTLGAVEIHTSNGPVNLTLPRNLQAAVRLGTSNGSIHTNLNGAQVSETHSSRNSFAATLNGGGHAQVSAETSNGSIRFDLTEPALPAEKPEQK